MFKIQRKYHKYLTPPNNSNNILSLFLIFISITSYQLLSIYFDTKSNTNNNTQKYSYYNQYKYFDFDNIKININDNGKFKIGIISDLLTDNNNYIRYLNKTLIENKPDLVILNGNIINNNSNKLRTIVCFDKLFSSLGIKFIYNFGQNENSILFTELFMDNIVNLVSSVNYKQTNYKGLTNQQILLMKENVPMFYLTLLDSNINGVSPEQLFYLTNICKLNSKINGMLFINEPLFEYNLLNNKENKYNKLNSGLFNTVSNCKNIKQIFMGEHEQSCSKYYNKDICFTKGNNIKYITIENFGKRVRL
jgi:hypothetical protein